MAGEVVCRTSLTSAFHKKQKLEWQKLRERLHLQLQQDIERIYTESLYCDLELVAAGAGAGAACVRTHRSILQVRASRLFSRLCLRDNGSGFHSIQLHEGSAQHVKAFICNLYSKCSVIEEEEELIQHLEGVTKATVFSSGDSGLSPESDIYLTPETSPSDLYHFTDAEKRSDQQEEHVKTLQKTNRSYYTIVSVEESFIEESGAKSVDNASILERELAEQDELLKSFESIKFKEEKRNDVKKIKKPSSLTFASSHYTKKYKRGCDIAGNNKDGFLHFVGGKANIEVAAKVNTFRKKDDRKRAKVEEEPEDEEFLDSPSETQVFELECCKKTELSPDDIFTSLCSPDMDASAGGPDSGLDTSSTGCIPGGGFSSPREHTISETSGVDLTEAAIGEEMPHDEDIDLLLRKPIKSSGSSSVSSDAGTWDSTFPSAQDVEVNSQVVVPESGNKCSIPSELVTWESTKLSTQDNRLQDNDIGSKSSQAGVPDSANKCGIPSDPVSWESTKLSTQNNRLQDKDLVCKRSQTALQEFANKGSTPLDPVSWKSTISSTQDNRLLDNNDVVCKISEAGVPESGNKGSIPSDPVSWKSTVSSTQENRLQEQVGSKISEAGVQDSVNKCSIPSDPISWESTVSTTQDNRLENVDIDSESSQLKLPEAVKKLNNEKIASVLVNGTPPVKANGLESKDLENKIYQVGDNGSLGSNWDNSVSSRQDKEVEDKRNCQQESVGWTAPSSQTEEVHMQLSEPSQKGREVEDKRNCQQESVGVTACTAPSAQTEVRMQLSEASQKGREVEDKRNCQQESVGVTACTAPSAQTEEVRMQLSAPSQRGREVEDKRNCQQESVGVTAPSAQTEEVRMQLSASSQKGREVEDKRNCQQESVGVTAPSAQTEEVRMQLCEPSQKGREVEDKRNCQQESVGVTACTAPSAQTEVVRMQLSEPSQKGREVEDERNCQQESVGVTACTAPSAQTEVVRMQLSEPSQKGREVEDERNCQQESVGVTACTAPSAQTEEVHMQLSAPSQRGREVEDERNCQQESVGVTTDTAPSAQTEKVHMQLSATSQRGREVEDKRNCQQESAGVTACTAPSAQTEEVHMQLSEASQRGREVESSSSSVTSPAKGSNAEHDAEVFNCELQANWNVSVCTGRNNSNYFINAADLVDELEVASLPPTRFPKQQDSEQENTATKDYHSLPEAMDSAIKPIPSCAEMVKTTCDIVNKGIMDCFNIKTKYTSSEVLPVESHAESFSEDMIPFLSSHLSISEDKGTDASVPASPHMKITSLKVSGIMKREASDGQDVVEEFQKEIKLTEQVEPYVAARKVPSSARKRYDSSESEDAVCRRKVNNLPEPETEGGETEKTTFSSLSSDKESEADTEPRRPSLIRRNTFELDPDDDRLALLRQEYERRQGNLLFQSCIPQFSGHVTGSEGFRDTQSLVVLPGKQSDLAMEEILQSSLPNISPPVMTSQVLDPETAVGTGSLVSDQSVVTGTPLRSPHMIPALANHDIHTPDSLNNDGLLDNLQAKDYEPQQDLDVNEGVGVVDNESEQRQKRLSSSFDNSMKPVISGALTCSDVVVEDKKSCDSPKKQKRTESTPIVSGGVSTADFVAPARSVTDSPIMARRKNESAPILSGGATILCDEPKPEESVVRPAVSSSPSVVSAWIVDMSDCTPVASKPPLEAKKRKKSDANNDTSKQTDNKASSLGFFVDLKPSPDSGAGKKPLPKSKKEIVSDIDVKDAPIGRRNSGVGFFVDLKEQKEIHETGRDESSSIRNEETKPLPKNSSCGFFVDLSEDEKRKQVNQHPAKNKKSQVAEEETKPESASDRKHALFSMFIDIGDSGQKNSSAGELVKSKVTSPQLSSHKRIESGPASLSGSCKLQQDVEDVKDQNGEQKNKKQGGFFMFIETDSPVTRRKTLPSGLRPNVNRHSWNLDGTTNEGTDYLRGTIKKHHKRTHSLSVEKGSVGSPDDSKSSSSTSLAKSRLRGSSQSLHESITSPEQVAVLQLEEEVSVKQMSTSCHARIPLKADRVTKRALSYEGKSESDIETISEAKEPTEKEIQKTSRHSASDKLKQAETFDVPEQSMKANSQAQVEEAEHKGNGSIGVNGSSSEVEVREVKSVETSFVKLSDLDKEPLKSLEDVADTNEVLPSFAAANRMTRSIPETSWIESKLLMTRSIGSGTSKSMSRLFPHLHATSSSSTNSAGRSKSPNLPENADDNDTQVSETSDLSSMQSSMGPSGLEGSTEETDASSSYAGRSGPVSRLGEDLLRMFLEEINPDVTVEVGGRRLKAHKCILSSRCQYFAAMLSGGWVESAGNVISLQGFSYNAVHFALCHIYSGTSNIPDSISIVELATLADMLGLEGLKEVIMYTLKVKYCHFFHKPCTMCAAGVLECLPLAAAYGLDDIYRKSLRWITKYFVRIWPTKGFASLPRELIEKCYQQHVVHMTVDNILETVMCCDKLLATLPNVRWAEPVFGITSQLLEASIKFIANNFCGVLSSESFLMLGKELSWNISRLEDSLMAATDRLPPDQACLSHAHLHRILTKAQSPEPPPEMQWSPNFIELLRRIQKRVEASLVRQAPRAARCTSWSQMELELRKKIQEAACLVLVPGEEGQRSRHSSLARRGQQSGNGNNVYCTAPRSIVSTGSRNLDIRQVKLAMTQQARRAASGGRVSTLKADTKTTRPQLSNTKKQQQQQQQQQPASTHHKAETIASQAKKVAAESGKASNGEGASRPKTWPLRVLENKARSAKQKANSSSSSMGTPEKSGPLPRRAGGKTLISSSDSSRTSSPAMRRSTSSGEGSGRCRAATLGTLTRRSETPPGRETRSRKKKDADGVAISTDSLSEPQSSSSCKCSVKEVSKSCIATRPDTPSVRRKLREEVAMSTDSLTESTASGERTASTRIESSASAPSRSIGVTRPDTPPVRERTKKRLGRASGEVSMSTDSLAAAEQGDISARKAELGRISKSSPGSSQDTSKAGIVKGTKVTEIRSENAIMRRLTARQSTISPRDSPTFRVRSEVASSPYLGSPSLRRSLLMASKSSSSENNNSKPGTPNASAKLEKAPAKSTPATSTNKRTTMRLQSTPGKTSVEPRKVTRQEVSRATPSKSVVNASKVNNNTFTRKALTNGTLVNGKNKQNNNVQSKKVAAEDKPPTVGSRSGTFLKDEPTILKKPDVDNVQE